jgi:hypothetical protein
MQGPEAVPEPVEPVEPSPSSIVALVDACRQESAADDCFTYCSQEELMRQVEDLARDAPTQGQQH